jgi:retron-type reverse transcriptase
MKRKGNLFYRVCSFENIHHAYFKARRGKRFKRDILDFNYHLEYNLIDTKEKLERKKYVHGGYKEFVVRDSKERLIRAPLFRDRVVHHSLCSVVEPIFENSFIFNSYACRKKKGAHKGIKRLKTFLKDNRGTYCLKCDISKYFDSINQDVLFKIIKRKIKDEKIVWLIDEIISSFNQETGVGIPIGNLTSQLFANIYLNELDQFVKHNLKQKKFVRYMDDFLILGKEKQTMHILKKEIKMFLENNLKLELNPKKANIFPIFLGIDFLGYILFQNYILLRKSTVKRLLRKIEKSMNSGGESIQCMVFLC